MPEIRWHRSLYWRVALGVVGLLAALIIAQSAIFLWMSSQFAGRLAPGEGVTLAQTVAVELRDAFERDPEVDARAFVRERYGRHARAFAVVLADGTAFGNHAVLPGGAVRGARAQLARTLNPAAVEARRPDGQPLAYPPDTAMIAVHDIVIGVVAVPPGRPPLMGVLRTLGPTLAVSAVALLMLGTGIAAVLVVAPVRQRLRALGDAAARIAAGNLTARAPEDSGDEVAVVATEFNRMAAALEQRSAELTAADRARRQLLADISHELMTPLTAMRGYLETLQMPEKVLDAETRARYVGVVADETRQVEHIVGDLLDLARLEDAALPVEARPVRIEPIFERVAARHERECRERRVELVRRVDAGVNEVSADPERLEQALQNLTANALRHTPDGGAVALAATRSATGMRLTVRDTGPGIEPQHLLHVFDRFYKVDAARSSAGSGLGLAIVKAIVTAHGGSVTVRNDGGAVFEIDLPGA